MPPKMKAKPKAPRKAKAQKQVQVPRYLRVGLDAQALAWARLLSDPCSAPLAHPCYAGADGGILTRFENSFDIGLGAAETAGLFVYIPNAIGNLSGASVGIVQGAAATAAVNLTLSGPTSATQPGYSFLSTNASNVRTVAACIQITYLGSEQNRSGIINYGNCNGGTFVLSDTPNTGNASNSFEHFERTPVNTIEVKWRPTAFDQTFKDNQINATNNELSKCGAVGFTFSGLAGAAGLRVRMVAVYEYTPAGAVGIVNTTSSRSTSGNTLDSVINYLDASGDWMTRVGHAMNSAYRGARMIEPYVRAVTYAGTRVPGLLM